MWRCIPLTFLLCVVWLPISCGPSSQGTRSTQKPDGVSPAQQERVTSSGDRPIERSELLPTNEPNVPFAMLGGGPRHLHRASVPGPKELPTEAARFHLGARIAASPTIGPDGTIYVGSIDGTFNALHRNGPLRWSYVCNAPIFSTAAISQTGRVYVGCDDHHLLAFSTDGTFRWSYKMKEDVDSPPVIGESGIIYVGGDALYALNADGRRQHKVWLGGHINASPTVRPDGIVAVGSHDHRFYLIDEVGTVTATFETKGPIQGTAAALAENDVIFGSDDGYVYRLSPGGGMRWKFHTDGPIRAGIAVNEDETRLFVASMDGAIYALDATSGKTVWKKETASAITASPMLDSAGMLYIGSRDHHLYAFDAETGETKWRFDMQCEIDATVAVASGQRLIVAGDDGVIRLLENTP